MTDYITAQHLHTNRRLQAYVNANGDANANDSANDSANHEPSRDQLLELYERRYKPALLNNHHAAATEDAATYFDRLLGGEGLEVIDGDDLIPAGANGQRPLYLGTPVSDGNGEGIDLPHTATTTGDANDESPLLSCPVPTAADRELLDALREHGHAATPAEVAGYAGADMDCLASATLAHYRRHNGQTVIATSAATAEDLARAANRAAAERLQEIFEASVQTAGRIRQALTGRLERLGGGSSLTGVKTHPAARGSSLTGVKAHLAARGYDRDAVRAVARELHRRGELGLSVKGEAPADDERDTRTYFVTLANAPEGTLARAASRYSDDLRQIPERRKAAADLARMRGQDKGFMAPFVPYNGTRVNAAGQTRALYVERAKALYNDAAPRGLASVTLRLAPVDATETAEELPAVEKVLYESDGHGCQGGGAGEFLTHHTAARVLDTLARHGVLRARELVERLLPEDSGEIVALLGEGRELSPVLSARYARFTSAISTLEEQGKVRRTRRGLALVCPKDDDSRPVAPHYEEQPDWGDEDPEPERESGPDPSGADKYAPDIPGAHDSRAIATGPEAPSQRPRQQQAARRRIGGAIRRAQQAKDAPEKARASLEQAQCNHAWHDARRIYMGSLPQAGRLELYLQLEGPQSFERMVEAADKPNLLFGAARELLDAGRITAEKAAGDNGSAYTRLSAVTPVDRRELAGKLLHVMATERIAVPQGTSLARRVEAVEHVTN